MESFKATMLVVTECMHVFECEEVFELPIYERPASNSSVIVEECAGMKKVGQI